MTLEQKAIQDDETKLLSLLDLSETHDLEFKSAEGGLPKSIWETISAFANTEGGSIVLGVTEDRDVYQVTGIKNPEAQLKEFWDNHNNPQKLSTRLCQESDVSVKIVDGFKIITINIPQALRTQRPVFINGNPLIGTYKRNHEGDYHCTEAEVRQMFRDASDEPQDQKILDGFSMLDLDAESLKSYRNRFRSHTPDHPFLAYDDQDMLRQLGGWRKDRISGKDGLTVAGLLMFGKERSILDAFPHFHLDYQEQFSADPEVRWTYRLTVDGTWNANLFNFYFQVYQRLVRDLNIPFELDHEAVRKGETHIHEALREALVNTLIHADHFATLPIKIVKHQNDFLFYNPGRLRIPVDQLYEGGLSDPRNPSLHKMFQLLGLVERAGTGFQKIFRAWKEQQWLQPLVSQKLDIEMTLVVLPMLSMIPDQVEKELRQLVGDAYPSLTETDRTILVLAHRFRDVSNADIQRYLSDTHPRDIGDRLKFLMDHKWLIRSGQKRGARYSLCMNNQAAVNSIDYAPNSIDYAPNSIHYSKNLQKILLKMRDGGRPSKHQIENAILELCAHDYVPLQKLAELLSRDMVYVRNDYLTPMVKKGLIQTQHPSPNHPKQAYKTKESP